jgi:hypothetical protein
VTPPDALTSQELLRILDRDRYAKNLLAEKVAALCLENAELMSIVDELQRDLTEARAVLAELRASQDLDSRSDGAVVHALPDEQPVSSR